MNFYRIGAWMINIRVGTKESIEEIRKFVGTSWAFWFHEIAAIHCKIVQKRFIPIQPLQKFNSTLKETYEHIHTIKNDLMDKQLRYHLRRCLMYFWTNPVSPLRVYRCDSQISIDKLLLLLYSYSNFCTANLWTQIDYLPENSIRLLGPLNAFVSIF